MYFSAKLLYIFFFACQGSAPPYLAVFYSSELNLKRDQIGLLVAIAPFISAIACPLWTVLADKTKGHRYIMCVIHTLATIFVVSVMGIPVVVALTRAESMQAQLALTLVTITSCGFAFFGVPVGPLVDGGVLKILGKKKELYGQQRMWGSISYGIASSIVGAIADYTKDMNVIFYVYATSAIAFICIAGSTEFKPERHQGTHLVRSAPTVSPSRLRRTQKNHRSRRERRSKNQATAGPSADSVDSDPPSRPFLNPSTSSEEESDDDEYLSPIRENDIQRLISFATESSIIEAVNFNIPPASRRMSLHESMEMAGNGAGEAAPPTTFLELMSQFKVLVFFGTMLLMGMALSMVGTFLLLFLKEDLQASTTLLGLTGLVGACTELVFFFYSRDLIRTFGIKSLIILGHVLTIIRVFCYTILPAGPQAANIALGLHLLNGIAFSALWGAGVVHADELTPPHLQATSQGVLAAMYAGLGAGLGSLLGGFLYEHWGAKNMFRAVICITTISLLTYLDTSTGYGLIGIWKRYWAWWERRKEAVRRGRMVPRWRRGGQIRLA